MFLSRIPDQDPNLFVIPEPGSGSEYFSYQILHKKRDEMYSKTTGTFFHASYGFRKTSFKSQITHPGSGSRIRKKYITDLDSFRSTGSRISEPGSATLDTGMRKCILGPKGVWEPGHSVGNGT
jgi:hypothetical protein